MRMSIWLGLSGCAGLAIAAGVSQDLALDRILKANEDALGGAEAISRVHTLRMTARVTGASGSASSVLVTWIKRPNLVRTESAIRGERVISGFDGTTAWTYDPLAASPASKIPDAQDALSLADANMDTAIGSLAGLKAAGADVALLGKEEFAGSPVYRLEITRKSGLAAIYLIDAATYLPVKTITKGYWRGLKTEVEAFAGDYGRVGDILFAHSIEQRIGGRVIGRVTYEKIEINVPMDDGIFKQPDRPAPPAKK
jgi:outer membrane lipoprotein-sorting protein